MIALLSMLKGYSLKKYLPYILGAVALVMGARFINNYFKTLGAAKVVDEYNTAQPFAAAKVSGLIDKMAEKERGWFGSGFSITFELPHYKELAAYNDQQLTYAHNYWQQKYAASFSGRSFKAQCNRMYWSSVKKPFAGRVVDRLTKLGF
jgi:hypothetical protein